MRITSGSLKGRNFNTHKKSHAMGDRVKQALFNSIDVTGMAVLDAFAGTGALSFEAISRGAKEVVAIEKDRKVFAVLKENVEELKIPVKAINANNISWSENNQDVQFDLCIFDPPYTNTQLDKVNTLLMHIKPKGLMVLSYPAREEVPSFDGVDLIDNKTYGDASLAYYRKS